MARTAAQLRARAKKLRAELREVRRELSKVDGGSRRRPASTPPVSTKRRRAPPSPPAKKRRRVNRGLLRSRLPPRSDYNTPLRRYLKPARITGRKPVRWMALVEVTARYPRLEDIDYVLALVMPIATPAQARKWTTEDVESEWRERQTSGEDHAFNRVLGIYEWIPRK